jgi:antitoxin MazE
VNTVTRAPIIKIGDSQGIRIPKLFFEQVDLGQEVELEVQEDQIVIRAAHRPRQGWDEQFEAMAQHGDDELLDKETLNLSNWDTDEWEWQSNDKSRLVRRLGRVNKSTQKGVLATLAEMFAE